MITCTRSAHYQVGEHPSMGREGAHGSPFLSEKTWIAERFWGNESQLPSQVRLLVDQPLTEEGVERTNWTQWVKKTKKKERCEIEEGGEVEVDLEGVRRSGTEENMITMSCMKF